jgi:hypothetical protein
MYAVIEHDFINDVSQISIQILHVNDEYKETEAGNY